MGSHAPSGCIYSMWNIWTTKYQCTVFRKSRPTESSKKSYISRWFHGRTHIPIEDWDCEGLQVAKEINRLWILTSISHKKSLCLVWTNEETFRAVCMREVHFGRMRDNAVAHRRGCHSRGIPHSQFLDRDHLGRKIESSLECSIHTRPSDQKRDEHMCHLQTPQRQERPFGRDEKRTLFD